MHTSIYLARLVGPVLVVLGIGILLGPSAYLAMAGSMMNDPPLLYLAAALGLLGGVALVLAHNVWAKDWRVILTLLGWITILDSASWILFADSMRRLWSPVLSEALLIACGALVLLVGAVLCYFGYVASSRPGART